MEVLFLYHRLYQTAQKQLESLRKLDFGTLEALTRDREKITKSLGENLRKHRESAGGNELTESVKRKIGELTAQTLDIDSEIKELLLEELKDRTMELAGISPPNE